MRGVLEKQLKFNKQRGGYKERRVLKCNHTIFSLQRSANVLIGNSQFIPSSSTVWLLWSYYTGENSSLCYIYLCFTLETCVLIWLIYFWWTVSNRGRGLQGKAGGLFSSREYFPKVIKLKITIHAECNIIFIVVSHCNIIFNINIHMFLDNCYSLLLLVQWCWFSLTLAQ